MPHRAMTNVLKEKEDCQRAVRDRLVITGERWLRTRTDLCRIVK